MMPPSAWVALLVWAATLVILALAAWHAEAERLFRPHRETAERAAAAGRWLRALEVRLAAWLFLAVLLWVRVATARADGASAEAGWTLVLSILAGLPPAALVVSAGWNVGRRRPFPPRYRWILAPFLGLSMWLHWVSGLSAGIWRRRWDARRLEYGPGQERVVSPERGVRDLASMPLEEVMIPRSQVVALEGSRNVGEAIRDVARSPHALYPVYGESVDHPLGVVWILDMGSPEARNRELRELVVPAPIVPETMKGLSLLGDLCGAPVPAALVVDEFGGMAGLVTVEDLIEVLVGDLAGEHEVVRTRVLPLGQGAYRVEGTTSVEEFNRRFGPLLPEGDYETVAGLVLERTGEIPQTGDEVELPGVVLEVADRTDRRILWLKARLQKVPGGPPDDAHRQ